MESKANYTLVGATVLLLLFGLLIASLWLSIGFDHKTYRTYVVYMRESVSGLNIDSVVKYNGVNVGYVRTININPQNPEQVELKLDIDVHAPITTSTEASLIMQGITGTTYLGLSSHSTTLSKLEARPGQPYPVIPYKRSFFNQLEKTIDELGTNINRVFNQANAEKLSQTIVNLESISHAVAQNNQNIDKSLQELPKILNEFQKTLQHFTSMAADVSTAGKQVSSTMKSGRNTLNKLSQQAIPPTVVLLRKLDNVAANLEKMSNQMQQNPAILLRGSAPPRLGPGEKR